MSGTQLHEALTPQKKQRRPRVGNAAGAVFLFTWRLAEHDADTAYLPQRRRCPLFGDQKTRFAASNFQRISK